MDKDDPREKKSRTLLCCPMFTRWNAERPEPILAIARKLMELPIQAALRTETSEPSRAKLRKEKDEAMWQLSRILQLESPRTKNLLCSEIAEPRRP
jgi:hypothetical protein